MIRVSIILPTYNASKTIDRCIESIINQTYKQWELICCDDCSTDNSFDILKKWEKKDNRIKVLKNEKNQKAAYTRNKCIKLARGEYVALIDDDDYCVVDRIEKQVLFLDKHSEYSFVGSKAYYFDENGVWKIGNAKEKPQIKDFLWSSCFINPSVMFRKRDLEDIGLYRVAKETIRSEDYDLFMRLYTKGYYGYNIQEPLIYYYRGKNSYKKCKYKFRINESIIRYQNYKRMGLLPKYFFYVLKPLVVGLIPIEILEKIKEGRR